MKPTVLLTGPDGILGNNLIPLLVKNGYLVRAFMEPGRDKNPVWERGAEVITGNLLNREEVAAAIAGCDYVIHAAANTNVWPPRDKKIREVNISGTQNVIDSVLQSDVKKLIHVGTANSFGAGTKAEPGDETRPYGCEKYGLDYMDSKYQAHLLVLQAIAEKDLPAVIVNPTFMIGPYDTKPSSGQLIISVCKGKIPGYTNGGRNYVDVRDVAQAIVNALEKGEIGQSYILGGQNLTYKEFFTMVAEVTGSKPPRMNVPGWVALATGRLNSGLGKIFRYNPGLSYPLARISKDTHFYSNRKAAEELEMPQTPLPVAIRDAWEWLKQNGKI